MEPDSLRELPQKRQRSTPHDVNSLLQESNENVVRNAMSPSGSSILKIVGNDSINIGTLALEHQLEAVRSEVQRERNMRRLDKVKSEQTENRLKRQIQFLLEETEEARTLLDQVRAQSESDMEKLSQSHSKTLQDLQDSDAKIKQLQMQQQTKNLESADAVFLMKKIELLNDKLHAAEAENRRMKQFDAGKVGQNNGNIVETPRKSSPENVDVSILSSPAPPEIMVELHRTRISLSEAQRQHRIQTRKTETMESKLLDNKSKLDLLKSCENKIILLEQENKRMRKDIELGKVLEKQWMAFRQEIDSLFETDPVSNTNDKDKSTKNTISVENMNEKKHPPEIATIIRHFRGMKQQVSKSHEEQKNSQSMLHASNKRIECLEKELRVQETNITDLRRQNKLFEEKLVCSMMENRKFQMQESISKREADGLRDILDTFDSKPENSSPRQTRFNKLSEMSNDGFRLSLSSLQEKLKASNDSYSDLKEKTNGILEEKENLQKELNRVTEKFGKLRTALMKEKEKVENAEQRACEAENLAGKGSYNTETTKVLHLESNPFTIALHEKYEKEIMKLKVEIQGLQEMKSPSISSSLSQNTPTSQSHNKKTPPSSSLSINAQKLHQRLKESFKEQISLFREGVYLITGYKIDMIADSEKPLFKVRSMYAETENDHLMFMWPQKLSEGNHQTVTALDLLDSDLAQQLSLTEAFGYITKFKSIPAFVASLTLSLFEKQTFMG